MQYAVTSVEKRSRKPVVTKGVPNNLAVPSSREMNAFKYEVANDLGLLDKINEVGFPNMTSRECGMIGGNMTKRMIDFAKRNLPQMIEEDIQLNNVIDVEGYADDDF